MGYAYIKRILIKALPLKPMPSPYSAIPSRGGNVAKAFIKILRLRSRRRDPEKSKIFREEGAHACKSEVLPNRHDERKRHSATRGNAPIGFPEGENRHRPGVAGGIGYGYN